MHLQVCQANVLFGALLYRKQARSADLKSTKRLPPSTKSIPSIPALLLHSRRKARYCMEGEIVLERSFLNDCFFR